MSQKHLLYLAALLLLLALSYHAGRPTPSSPVELPLSPPPSSAPAVSAATAAPSTAVPVAPPAPVKKVTPPALDPIMVSYLGAQVNDMQQALALRTDQAQRLQTILQKHLPDRAALVTAAAAPAEDEAAAETLLEGAQAMAALRRPGAYADEVNALLQPEQRSAWATRLQKMAQDDAEIVSTRELAAIQARHSLTEQQKDSVYQCLHEIALKEQTGPSVSFTNPEEDSAQLQRRLQALSAVFPQSELEGVKHILEASSAERWLLPLEKLGIFDPDLE